MSHIAIIGEVRVAVAKIIGERGIIDVEFLILSAIRNENFSTELTLGKHIEATGKFHKTSLVGIGIIVVYELHVIHRSERRAGHRKDGTLRDKYLECPVFPN